MDEKHSSNKREDSKAIKQSDDNPQKITNFFPLLRTEGRAKMCGLKTDDSKQKEMLKKIRIKSKESMTLRSKRQDKPGEKSVNGSTPNQGKEKVRNISVASALKTPLSQVLRKSIEASDKKEPGKSNQTKNSESSGKTNQKFSESSEKTSQIKIAENSSKTSLIKISDNSGKTSQSKISDNSGKTSQSKISDNSGKTSQSKISDNSGKTSQSKISDNSVKTSQSKISENSGKTSQTKISENSKKISQTKIFENSGKTNQTKMAENSGKTNQTKISEISGKTNQTKISENISKNAYSETKRNLSDNDSGRMLRQKTPTSEKPVRSNVVYKRRTEVSQTTAVNEKGKSSTSSETHRGRPPKVVTYALDTVGEDGKSDSGSLNSNNNAKVVRKYRKRHFRGSTYGLYLTPARKKKKKLKSQDESKDDECSVTSTENNSFLDSEDANSLVSEDFFTPSEKSLVDEEHGLESQNSSTLPCAEKKSENLEQISSMETEEVNVKEENTEEKKPESKIEISADYEENTQNVTDLFQDLEEMQWESDQKVNEEVDNTNCSQGSKPPQYDDISSESFTNSLHFSFKKNSPKNSEEPYTKEDLIVQSKSEPVDTNSNCDLAEKSSHKIDLPDTSETCLSINDNLSEMFDLKDDSNVASSDMSENKEDLNILNSDLSEIKEDLNLVSTDMLINKDSLNLVFPDVNEGKDDSNLISGDIAESKDLNMDSSDVPEKDYNIISPQPFSESKENSNLMPSDVTENKDSELSHLDVSEGKEIHSSDSLSAVENKHDSNSLPSVQETKELNSLTFTGQKLDSDSVKFSNVKEHNSNSPFRNESRLDSNSLPFTSENKQDSNSLPSSNIFTSDNKQDSNSSLFTNENKEDYNPLCVTNENKQDSNSLTFTNENKQDSNSLTFTNENKQDSNSLTFSNQNKQDSNSLTFSNQNKQDSNSLTFANENKQDSNSLLFTNVNKQDSNSLLFSNVNKQDSNSLSFINENKQDSNSLHFINENKQDSNSLPFADGNKLDSNSITFPEKRNDSNSAFSDEKKPSDSLQFNNKDDESVMINSTEKSPEELEDELKCKNDDNLISHMEVDNLDKQNDDEEDDDQSTIATCVKSRQRIKRRFTDDIVDTDLGILSAAAMASVNKKAMTTRQDTPKDIIENFQSVTRSEAKKTGPVARIECVFNYKQSPIKSCTCEGETYQAKIDRNEETAFCQAVDSIDDKLVGCSNPVVTSQLVRPSVKLAFTIMCETHLWRLRHHHACPYCGLFCSQGSFMACSSEKNPMTVHYFHEQCQTKEDGSMPFCFHCGSSGSLKRLHLEMHMNSPPSFFLSQSSKVSVPDVSKARISFSESPDFIKKEDDESSQMFKIEDSGRVLSTAGLPNGTSKEELEKLIYALNEEKVRNCNFALDEFYDMAAIGNILKVLYMLAKGMDPNQKFETHEGETALHAAAANGHVTVVHLLVQAGAVNDSLNEKMYTPLMLAAENSHRDVVHYLVKKGALTDFKGENGMSSLHLAAKSGDLDVLKILMSSREIDIDAQDDGGWTPIVWASEHDHLNVVRYLLKRGANPNIKDNEGNIGLHWSAFSGSVEISYLYLDYGCDINAVNELGDTPLHIAARQDSFPCVTLFLSRGADVTIQNKANKLPAECCIDKNSDTYLSLSLNMLLKKITGKYQHKAEKIIHRDISRGKEQLAIQCVNAVDDEMPPLDFLYVTENCETMPIKIDRTITSLQSCHCEDDCATASCSCASISYQCWYDKEGLLLPEFNLLDPPMLFECNRACSCWSLNCHNRVLQNGITSRLQLIRTKGKGWGVRTLKDIPKGAFICEYVGELISDSAADKRADDSYLFDLDNRDGETYCLDARYYGNISRFINHLCEPNLVPVKVYVDHQDLNFPRIAFFSSRDIKQYEELGFDYGEKFWAIKYKSFTCECGTLKCKYSKESIHITLANYYRRLKEEQMEEAAAQAQLLPPEVIVQ